ncbi:MAG: hypothetical protein QW303_00135, partial [Nitrososphaerota archaeon]
MLDRFMFKPDWYDLMHESAQIKNKFYEFQKCNSFLKISKRLKLIKFLFKNTEYAENGFTIEDFYLILNKISESFHKRNTNHEEGLNKVTEELIKSIEKSLQSTTECQLVLKKSQNAFTKTDKASQNKSIIDTYNLIKKIKRVLNKLLIKVKENAYFETLVLYKDIHLLQTMTTTIISQFRTCFKSSLRKSLCSEKHKLIRDAIRSINTATKQVREINSLMIKMLDTIRSASAVYSILYPDATNLKIIFVTLLMLSKNQKYDGLIKYVLDD